MRKIAFYTLGCKVNQADTASMEGIFRASGYEVVPFGEPADVYLVNTCVVTNTGQRKSRQIINRAVRHNPLSLVVVTGCYPQTAPEEVRAIEGVDVIIGNQERGRIVELVEEALEHKRTEILDNVQQMTVDTKFEELGVGTETDKTRAFLKIQEGCNQYCTYCIIPYIRGNYRSVPMDELVTSAEELVAGGVKELILVAQETTLYGVDLYGKKCLHELLDRLNGISGLFWIRIMYCYPEEIYEELIDSMIKDKKVCHYLDMPIQHASDAILKRMGRRTSRQELIDIITKLRKEIPDIALRTTLITGFPGETQEDHEQMMEFVDSMEFDRLGVFTYSPEEGTPAAEMDNQIDEEVKEQWRDEVMELQQEVSLDKSADMVGKTIEVMIEGKISDDEAYVGRSYKDAPNVDGFVFVNTTANLMSGAIVHVEITGAMEYDLIGSLVED